MSYESFIGWFDDCVWKRIVFKHLLGNFIPTFIPIFYTVPAVKSFTISLIKKNVSKNTYDDISQLWVQIAIIALVYFITPILKDELNQYAKRKENFLQEKQEKIQTLMACVSVVVNEKKKRFYSFSKNGLSNIQNVFNEITQPLLQMLTIVKSVQSFYQETLHDKNIDCYLYDVKCGCVCAEKACTCIGNSQIDLQNVQNNRYVKDCISKKDMKIIPNISTKKDELLNNSNLDRILSAIFYPIRNGTQVEYIIIVASKTKSFEKKDKELYKYVLEEFSNRIELESYLNQIKGAVNAQTT